MGERLGAKGGKDGAVVRGEEHRADPERPGVPSWRTAGCSSVAGLLGKEPGKEREERLGSLGLGEPKAHEVAGEPRVWRCAWSGGHEGSVGEWRWPRVRRLWGIAEGWASVADSSGPVWACPRGPRVRLVRWGKSVPRCPGEMGQPPWVGGELLGEGRMNMW